MNGPLVPLHGPVRSRFPITELPKAYLFTRAIGSRDVPTWGVGKCRIILK